MFQSVKARIAALISVMGLTAAIAVPLLSNAQDAATPMTAEEQIERGAAIYYSVCVACHQADGNGVPGIYLPLNKGAIANLDDPTLFIYTVLYGRGGMPRFNTTYSDEEIAAILTYIRQAWENDAGAVTPEEVKAVREAYSATPIVSPTPDAQIPEGQNHPEERQDPSKASTPDA
ncbi:MAG: cytochrome c [Thermomicrobiales bacterium]|nr:cytochrome c [Thermomicrobiales bacterium]MCO5226682.1 cytochrome c [Thermomicrobiales bacterium]